MKAAKRVFARKGFHQAAMSAIAQEAGLSETTIYEYFSSKEEILFSIPAETSRQLAKMIEMPLKVIKGATNKLRALIYLLLMLHQNDPDYAAVSYLILKQNRKYVKTESYHLLRQRLRPYYDVIEEGIATGEFRNDLTPYLIRSTVMGTIEHLVIRKLLTGTQDNLVDYVDDILSLVTQGIEVKTPKKFNFSITLEEKDDRTVQPGKTEQNQ